MSEEADSDCGGRKSVATQLVELARQRYHLGIDLDGMPFAVEVDGPNLALPFRGGKPGLRSRLSADYYASERRVAPASALADALVALEGEAAMSEPSACAMRVAADGGAVVLDLGSAAGDVVRVTPSGWREMAVSPVTFKRTGLTGSLPRPVAGGRLDELRELVNVTDDSWPLLVGWVIACFLPGIPHPVLSLSGEMGTGKTTAAATIVSIFDPSPAPVRTAPRDADAWAVTAAGSWAVALDNLSGIPIWLSDALCRAVTGDGLVRRRLYSDGDLVVFNFRRCVILTAIDAGAMRGDLADRLVRVELDRIHPSVRRTDADVAARLAEARPRILGAALDVVADVLRVLPTVELDTMPRMADYAKVLAAIDMVTGLGCLPRYLGLGAELMADVVDDDPIASAVRDLCVREGGAWDGLASELLDAISPAHPPKGWPANARTMSASLKNATTALRAVGIETSRGAGKDRRRIYLAATDVACNPASLPSPAT